MKFSNIQMYIVSAAPCKRHHHLQQVSGHGQSCCTYILPNPFNLPSSTGQFENKSQSIISLVAIKDF